MFPQPILTTDRLTLRPFAPADAPAVERMAGAFEVADTTLTIPHPYPTGGGALWIATHAPSWEVGELATYAVTITGELVGAISLTFAVAHRRAELGYWIGVPFWGRGLATEAAHAVIAMGFERLDLNRIQAMHLTRNPASGRVMQKAGMALEGVHREYFLKNGRFEDVARYALLRQDWRAASSRAGAAGRAARTSLATDNDSR
jgi:RimJ/RimL family protein N-acetyltransferase